MTGMVTPYTRTPGPGVMKFSILIDPFLVIITTYSDLDIQCFETFRHILLRNFWIALESVKISPMYKIVFILNDYKAHMSNDFMFGCLAW